MDMDESVKNPWTNPRAAVVRCVLVDSRDRDFSRFPTPNRYSVRLPRKYHNVTSAKLMSAEIPSTFYLYSASRGNTSLLVTYQTQTRTVTISDGNYDTNSLCTALTAALNTAFSPATFSVTVDSSTYKMTIAVVSDPTATLSLDTTSQSPNETDWGLAYSCGFPKNQTIAGTGGVVSTNAVVPNPVTYILLSIRQLDRTDEPNIYGPGGGGLVFAKIPMNVDSGGFAFFDKHHFCCNELNPPKTIEDLTIELRMHDGTVLDFNGCEHSLTIELVCTDTR